jgi:hypothetical protein
MGWIEPVTLTGAHVVLEPADTRHQYIRRDGSLRDTVMYSIIPEERPAVKARLRARLEAHGCE